MGGLKHLKEKGHKVTAHHGRDKQMAGRTLQQQSSLVAGGGGGVGVWGCGEETTSYRGINVRIAHWLLGKPAERLGPISPSG